jgi:hypothetical protein
MTCATLLNLGHVMVFNPSEVHKSPSQEEVQRWALDDDKPKGVWTMNKDPHKDELTLVLGCSSNTFSKQTAKVPVTLAMELRAYLEKMPPKQQFLFTDLRHSINVSESKPYIGTSGRASFISRTNRMLYSLFKCRLRPFRLAVALHRQQEAMEDLQVHGSQSSVNPVQKI